MLTWEGQWRHDGSISPTLQEQLLQVEPSTDRNLEYRPYSVALRDGRTLDRVYVLDVHAYIRVWGVWPEDDAGKQSVHIEDLVRIEDSPSAGPPGEQDVRHR
jgi:hypothetical protein